MIKFNRDQLKDKVYACWLGKNIGGTLGTPYEGKRQVNDIHGFKSEPGNPLPNDDLDLQLAWLKAVEREGIKNVNERVLGEYWMEYVSPFWNEYGIGKANMTHGLVAPMCGQYNNSWKHSNGAWIRTEVWASLFPADIENAVKYAYYDACVDHGVGEGTYAAIFVAAIESAAFVISDMRELINIGLSKIPETTRFYKYITTVLDCYDSGKTWLEARNLITDMTLADEELGWFQAPANVAYTVIGLLYGEGDFKQSLIIAINCGDDTDCTGATAGALLGIIGGTKVIPEDWKAYIGDSIVTVAISRGALYGVPTSCTALTDCIMNLHHTTGVHYAEADEVPAEDVANFKGRAFADMLGKRTQYFCEYDSILAHAVLEYDDAPDMVSGKTLGAKLTLTRKLTAQKHFEVRWLMPEGWTVTGPKTINVTEPKNFQFFTSANYTITAGEKVEAKNRGVIEITCDGRADVLLIPIVFFG